MPPEEAHRIEVQLDKLLEARGMTLTRLCEVLECQPGDLLRYTD
jgi:DNA-binding Xre family transcriptional regulator